jgi:hypothetical protein
LISADLEPHQQHKTGAQLSVVAPFVPAAALPTLLASFRGARLVGPIARSIPSPELTVWVDVAAPRSFRGARILEPIIRATSPREPTVRISYASLPPEPGQLDDSFQTFAFDKNLNGGDRSALKSHSRNGKLGLKGSAAKIAQHARALRPARQDEGRIVFPAQPDEGFFVDADKGDFHRDALRVAAAGPPARLPVRAIIEGTAEYRQIFETRTPGFTTFPGSMGGHGRKDSKIKPEGFDRTFTRGSREPDTEETRATTNGEWEATRKKCEALILADKAWSPWDPQEDTRIFSTPKGEVKINLSNPTFKRIMVEIEKYRRNFDTLEELHEQLGLSYETERKKELEDLNMKKECPTTPFTKVQIDDLNARDGRLVFVHVVMDKPRWYKLDMEKHDTYKDAIHEIFSKSFEEACRVAGIPILRRKVDSRTNAEAPEEALAFKKIAVRYAEYFKPENIYVLDLRNLSPLAAAFAEESDAA